MEFSNLKHLAKSGIRKQNSMSRVKTLAALTGPGQKTFLQYQCNVSVFARPCSCCLDESVISSKANGSDRDASQAPMTQLLPFASAPSVAFVHLVLFPKTSWLICSYPAGPKCFRYNVDFPMLG